MAVPQTCCLSAILYISDSAVSASLYLFIKALQHLANDGLYLWTLLGVLRKHRVCRQIVLIPSSHRRTLVMPLLNTSTENAALCAAVNMEKEKQVVIYKNIKQSGTFSSRELCVHFSTKPDVIVMFLQSNRDFKKLSCAVKLGSNKMCPFANLFDIYLIKNRTQAEDVFTSSASLIFANNCLYWLWCQQHISDTLVEEQQKTGRSVEWSRNTCREHSTGEQVHR